MNRKYPHLNRPSSSSNIPVVDADDVPPPLPPRPIETLQPQPDDLESEEESEDEGEVKRVGDVAGPFTAPYDNGASPHLVSELPPPPPPTTAPPPSSPSPPPPPSDVSQPPPPPPDSVERGKCIHLIFVADWCQEKWVDQNSLPLPPILLTGFHGSDNSI